MSCDIGSPGPTRIRFAARAGPRELMRAVRRFALSDGLTFGVTGPGHVRLTLGTPHALLTERLEPMRKALAAR
jgi:bifunctional pyridoxal-dependent enzyme with beta-cystathionase and maltose regulon repressor activities